MHAHVGVILYTADALHYVC